MAEAGQTGSRERLNKQLPTAAYQQNQEFLTAVTYDFTAQLRIARPNCA
jgi:hypothetical protein